MRNSDGSPIRGSEELRLKLVAYWESVFTVGHWPYKTAGLPPNVPLVTNPEGLTDYFTTKELRVSLKELKNNKSPGLSNIPNEFLKHSPMEMQIIVVFWFRKMWSEEETPDDIGCDKITLLHKKGANSDLQNYRTLAVGCNILKVYLKLLERHLTTCVERSGLLGDMQNGFRKGRRCQHNLLVLDHIIQRAKRTGGRLYLALLDITKAYDRMDRDILWKKMSLYGFPAKFIWVLNGTYRNPVGILEFQGASTGRLAMPVGLKQGCVLSPILFALYIADLCVELQTLG